jgi:peptidyl-dipeptidase Dcp
VLRHYARHHRTGEPLPEALVGKVIAAGKFHQGYRTTEYLAAAVLDQAWHQLAPEEVPGPEGVLAFEAAVLRRAGLDFAAVPPRYRTPYFSHVFSSGYSAGYYSYLWAEVLDADAVEWFRGNGGLTRANGDRLRRTVLARGGSADAMQLYRDFRGTDPELKPLLQRRGLEPSAEAAR